MRTTRQRSKPVNLIVKKTDYGYEVLEDKDSAPILPAKSRKSEKLGSPAKSSVSKSGEKEGDTVSTNTTPVATRPAKTKVQKSNTKNLKQQQQAKSPSVHTESEAAKKEELINTFASPSEPNFTIHQEISKNDVPSAGQERPEKPETTGKSERTERQERVERERPAKMTEPKFSEPKSLDLGSYEHLQVMKKYPVVVPTVGSWFSFDKIDPIEKENLPEFFAGKPSKTPEVYKKYRNFMVNLYRSNPRHYLHATTCRRSLAGDVNGILRIHAFLEQNGLINFSVEPSTLPQHLYLLKPSLELGNRYKVKSREVKNDFVEQEKANTARNSENDLLMTQIRILNKQSRPQCNYCGLMCGIVWYHQKGSGSFQQSVYGSDSGSMSGEIMLCLKCFTEGHLPDGIPQSEFHKVNLLDKYNPNFPKNPNPSYWTQEETLRLLDLFQMEKDPWEEIPRYFPYKAKDDIILHWLQLPVKNISLLESLGFNDEDGYDQTTAERVSSLAQGLFDDGFSNPLMSHMGVFKEVLDKYTGGGQDILKEEKKGDEGIIEEKREEGYEGKQMEVEYAKEQKRQDNETMQVEEKGKDNENGLGEGTEPANGRRSDIAIIELGKSNMEKKVVDGRLERMFTIVDKEGEILEDVEKQTKERANILKKKEEEKIRETANILIDLQINKLEAKLSFLEEYEKVLGQEKKQNESFQKMTLAERIYLVQKKLDAAKPPVVQAPAQQAQPQNPFYDSREPGYLNNFYNQMGNVNIDDMLSLGHHDRDDFQTDGF